MSVSFCALSVNHPQKFPCHRRCLELHSRANLSFLVNLAFSRLVQCHSNLDQNSKTKKKKINIVFGPDQSK